MTALSTLVSYQSADHPASVLLRDELAMRGTMVVHDRTTFGTGNSVIVEMDEAVARCHGFVAYITPDYLYESAVTGSFRPALDREFIPAMRRAMQAISAAAANGGDARSARPVLYPVLRHFEGSRADAIARIRAATGYDISGIWAPDQNHDSADLTQPAAAAVARDLVGRLMPPGWGSDMPHEMSLTTRGISVPSDCFSIDATPLLGGDFNRSGDPADWARLRDALVDVRALLSAHTRNRHIELTIRGHLSAGILFGRVFHQGAGWRLQVPGRHGTATTDTTDDVADPDLEHQWHPQLAGSEWMSVEIDLLGCNVYDLVTRYHRHADSPPLGRLHLHRGSSASDLKPTQIEVMARSAARAIRSRVSSEHPARVSIACAAPVDFAVLLGHRLSALYADLELLERDGTAYTPMVTVPSAT